LNTRFIFQKGKIMFKQLLSLVRQMFIGRLLAGQKLLPVALLVLCGGVHAACPTRPTADRFSINGAEVTDKQTGVVWARCSVGQSWSGNTCTGTARTFTHEGALAHVATQSGWRLPTVKELSGLADKACQNPAIDSAAFPATPSSWFWTSSPSSGSSNFAWVVYFHDGYVYGYYFRNYSFLLRLVRAS
jgi:hypothetical protein